MVSYVEANHINKVLVTELSRLGRDTLQVLEVIQMLNEKGISLYIQNYNIETLTKDGKVNAMSQFLITILAEVARMERKTIRERVESGYKNYRANGGKVGRKIGYKKAEETIRKQYTEEIKLLKRGIHYAIYLRLRERLSTLSESARASSNLVFNFLLGIFDSDVL